MAKKPDGKPAGTERVSFTRPAAERIGRAVRQVEAGDRDLGPIEWGPRGGAASGKVFRVGTFTGAWAINSAKAVTFLNVTNTPNTASVINKLVNLPAPRSTATSRIVNIAKDGPQWYLVSFQMATATAVFSDSTQTMTFVGTGATQTITFFSASNTQTITYASPGSAVSVLTDLSASLNTTDCTITVNKTTASFRIVGQTQTASTVSVSGTQTATVISMPGTQTAVISTGTYTATYITLEL
jgi:hypothetical protein